MTARLAALALSLALAGCAGWGVRDPLSVNVVGIEPIQGESMETRFDLKLRVQNPGETPIEYDGVYVELEVRGDKLASGVSDRKGVVPRFGETVVVVPMSAPVGAMIRQVIGLVTGDNVRIDYRLRGRLAGPGLADHRFHSKGELQLPVGFLDARK